MPDFDSIDEALNVESSIVGVDKPAPIKRPEEKNDISKDYEYTRANLYSLIEKGQEAINGIMELAGESASPRAYEVAGQLIKVWQIPLISWQTFKRNLKILKKIVLQKVQTVLQTMQYLLVLHLSCRNY